MTYQFSLNSCSHKIVKLIDIIVTNLQEVKAIISYLVIPDGANESFKLVDIEGLSAKRVIIQRVNNLLLDEVKQAVPVEMNVLSSDTLHIG